MAGLSRNLVTLVGLTSLAVSAALNLYLLQAVPQGNSARPPRLLQLGTEIQELKASTSDGVPVSIALPPRQSSLIYVMSPRCTWCDRNHHNVLALARLNQDKVRLIGISVLQPGLKEYLERFRLPFPVYSVERDSLQTSLKSTPQLVLVGPDGKVSKVWPGLLSAADLLDVLDEAH